MCGALVDGQNHGILPYWFNQSVTSKACKNLQNFPTIETGKRIRRQDDDMVANNNGLALVQPGVVEMYSPLRSTSTVSGLMTGIAPNCILHPFPL
jgi:hypothetical protein